MLEPDRAGDAPDSALHVQPLPPMTDRDFARARDIVFADSGVQLTAQKRELVTARLSRRIRNLGLTGFRQYLELVASDRRERVEMLDRILTNETRFFREPRQFEVIRQTLVPVWRAAAESGRRQRTLRAWSAGCSTGQEPVSLAMVLLDALPDWHIEVLASDLSTRALRAAMRGEWPLEKAGEIPVPLRREFMLRGVRTREGVMRATTASCP